MEIEHKMHNDQKFPNKENTRNWFGDYPSHFDKMTIPTALSNYETEMMTNSKRDLDSNTVRDAVDKLRLLCLSKGTTGILSLVRCLHRIDDNGKKVLCLMPFTNGLKESGLYVTDEEARDIFYKFNNDGTTHINMMDFLTALRPYMSDSRIELVNRAFKKLDRKGVGKITKDDIKAVYNVHSNPEYINGDETEDEIIEKFLAHFKEGGEEGDVDEKFTHFVLHWKHLIMDVLFPGHITQEEFDSYYAAVSASIKEDGYFDLIMRQAYQL